MREPDFLPDWYPPLLRRRAAVFIQATATVVICVGLAIGSLFSQQQVRLAQAALAAVQAQLDQSGVDLQRLSDIEAVKQQLEQQDQVLRRLGVYVPASRMLGALEESMPPGMALVDLQMHTEESALPLSDADPARGASPRVTRNLRLHLIGLTPSEDDLASFFTKLVAVPYFREVELVKSEEHAQASRLARRFEVRFALDLDDSRPRSLAGAQEEESR